MDGPSNIDLIATAILICIYGYIIKTGAKYGSFTLMFYGFLCIVGVNLNTFLIDYPLPRAVGRVLVGVAILLLLRRAIKLYAERIADKDAIIKKLSEYER